MNLADLSEQGSDGIVEKEPLDANSEPVSSRYASAKTTPAKGKKLLNRDSQPTTLPHAAG
jgi:hypothetical protein